MSDQFTFATVDGHVPVDTIALFLDIDLSDDSVLAFAADLAADSDPADPADPKAVRYSAANLLAAASHLRTCQFCSGLQEQLAGALTTSMAQLTVPPASVQANHLSAAAAAFAGTAVSSAAASTADELAANHRKVETKAGLLQRVFRGNRTVGGSGSGGVSVGSGGVAWRTSAIAVASAALLAAAFWGITRGARTTEVGSPPIAAATSTVVTSQDAVVSETAAAAEPSAEVAGISEEESAPSADGLTSAANGNSLSSTEAVAAPLDSALPQSASESPSGSSDQLEFDGPVARSSEAQSASAQPAPNTAASTAALTPPSTAAVRPTVAAATKPPTVATVAPVPRNTSVPSATTAQTKAAAVASKKKATQPAAQAAAAEAVQPAEVAGEAASQSAASPLPPAVAQSPAPAASRTAAAKTAPAIFLGELTSAPIEQILIDFNSRILVQSGKSATNPASPQIVSTAPNGGQPSTTLGQTPLPTAAPSAGAPNLLDVVSTCARLTESNQPGTVVLYTATSVVDGNLVIVLRRSLNGQVEDLVVKADCTNVLTRPVS